LASTNARIPTSRFVASCADLFSRDTRRENVAFQRRRATGSTTQGLFSGLNLVRSV